MLILFRVRVVRDSSGLALSSRNAYLSADEVKEALAISRSLKRASKLVMQGVLDTSTIERESERCYEKLRYRVYSLCQ